MSSTVNNGDENNENERELTRIQEMFLLGMQQLKHYEGIRETRHLTKEEVFEEDKLKTQLFKLVEKFARQTMNNYIKGYRCDSDAREDIIAEISDKFMKKLDSYDPSQTTPTTYFNKDFFEIIRTYVNERSQHLSTNDAGKLKVLNQAQKECEAIGIEPSVEILHSMTGMTHKMILQTQKKAGNTIYGDVADVEESSKILNPEDIYIHEETLDTLHQVISDCLTPDEIQFFMIYANLDSNSSKPTKDDHLTYKEMEKIFDMKEHEVKAKLSKIIIKLSTRANKLMNIGGVKDDFHSNLNFIDSSTNEIENDILDFFTKRDTDDE